MERLAATWQVDPQSLPIIAPQRRSLIYDRILPPLVWNDLPWPSPKYRTYAYRRGVTALEAVAKFIPSPQRGGVAKLALGFSSTRRATWRLDYENERCGTLGDI